jgi:2-(1,2-epoxy-1,2-dihydrophenyl)acetyl-CoA isomerase
MHMVLTGEAVPADEALRIGLVGRVWGEEEFAAGWRAFAREIAAGATEAYALSKEGLNAGFEGDLSSFLDVEAALQDRAGRTSDYAEGVRAFLEKRAASFSGR